MENFTCGQKSEKPAAEKKTDNFTPAQKKAVLCDATEILVSAAAGSGKTAVLTERIIRHISEGIPLEKLLVVTFTEAAAAEMRERVEKKLHENARLSHYAALLPAAEISTIHAFCRRLLKEHFQDVGIDPSFKIGDNAELSLVRAQVMDALFEAEYAADNADFLDLAHVYGGKTSDGRLELLVSGIFDFMESDPFPAEAAKRYAAAFENIADIDATPWAKIAREELTLGLAGAAESLRLAIEICNAPAGPIEYVEKLHEELKFFEGGLGKTFFQKSFPQGLSFEELYTKFSRIEWGRLPTITAKDEVAPALKERVLRIRNKAVKERVKKLVQGVFFAPPGKMADDLRALAPRVNALMRLATRFSEEYAKEKRARNIMDFSDLEHFAIRILYPSGPENMTPAPLAQKFHEVLIDEYQDSNETQDLILSAVAERRFMVGDVKQSIYRFRRANPQMFVEKYEKFAGVLPPHPHPLFEKSGAKTLSGEPPQSGGSRQSFEAHPGEADAAKRQAARPAHEMRERGVRGNFFKSSPEKDSFGVRIDLSHNFRSRPEVLGAVNFLFSQLMCREVGDVDYNDAAALHAGHAEYPEAEASQMWVELLETADEIESDERDDDPISGTIAETRIIAECIKELLATRKIFDEQTREFRACRQGDIAILSRSFSGIAGAVIEELKSNGIDAIADMNDGFFEQQEIKTALAFLRVIDNPRQDIDLLVALTSPVYAFTADELFEISRADGGDFYEKLLTQASQKSKKFFSNLRVLREAAVFMPISRLIGFVYDTTGYPAHVANMAGGAIRQANLRLLLERAIEFEDAGQKGLFHFVRYIERLSDSGGIASAAAPADFADKVRLMTIHKSKGLEFPIVICAFLAKKFNTDDERRPVILHSAEGIGAYYVNTKLRTRSNTLARFALSRLTRRENLSEELRCLYVAMTRAKEHLILTARVKNLAEATEKWRDHIGSPEKILPTHYRRGVSNYLDWIMPCLLNKEAEGFFRVRPWGKTFSEEKVFPQTPFQKDFNIETTQSAVSSQSLGQAFSKACGGSGAAPPRSYPSKLSISEIKRLYDITPDSSFRESPPTSFEPPSFIRAQSGVTPARIGSALHKITEFIDYAQHTSEAEIEKLIAELVAKNLLDAEDAAALDRAKVKTLANSPLADRLRNAAAAKKLWRETPFVLALPVARLYAEAEENETILVHGIIDCHFEENGKLVLVDFKSDNIPHSTGLDEWARSHGVQLEIYRQALENSADMPVGEVLLYSFARGAAVEIPIETGAK